MTKLKAKMTRLKGKMIASKNEITLIEGQIDEIGLCKDLPSFTRELFRILDTLEHGIGNHATNETLLVSFVLLPLRMKIEQMLENNSAYEIVGEPEKAKLKDIYDRILNGEEIGFSEGLW